MKLTIREPKAGDLGWLISTHGSLYSQQYNFDSDFEIDIARKVISFIESKHAFNRIFIAQVNSRRAGSIAVSIKSDDSAFINFLLVKNQYRGQGIGKKIMEKVISHTVDNGLRFMRLETYSCLQNARKMYEKYDFKMYKKNPAIEKYGQVFDQEFWEKEIT